MLLKVAISNIGLMAVIFGLYKWAQVSSFAEVMALYIGPYLVVNAWLTGVTFLQHTDINIPHYDETAWNWLKGIND
jgi:omega-6 fatty acid desaturase (delta-12 desaturase)